MAVTDLFQYNVINIMDKLNKESNIKLKVKLIVNIKINNIFVKYGNIY